MFIQTGITVFNAIFQLFIISLAAGILTRKGVVKGEQVSALSDVTVNVFLPCLIVAKILVQFDPATLPLWWIMPLSGAIMVVAGLFLSGLFFKFRHEKRPLMTLASMQNGIYIVLPIGQILFPDQFDVFAFYCFLLVLGLNPVVWSLGKVMISGKANTDIRLKDFVTPPLAAIFFSVAAVFSNIVAYIPKSIIASVDLLGQATVPAAVFVLGATMGTISLRQMPNLKDILVVALVKFMLIPAGTFAVLYWGGIYESLPLFCNMLIIQACAPPATNLILIVKSYGGDSQAISTMMLILYGLSILIMPMWISAWLALIN